MTPTLLISFSGGRTSAFMTRYILESPKYKHFHKIIAFANTGKERPETLDFVHECDQRWQLGIVWVEAVIDQTMGIGTSFRVVDYHSASREGEPFESLIRKYGIPNVSRPHCTRELKITPIRKYLQSLGLKQWITALGIPQDEKRRSHRFTAQKEGKIFPLADDLLCTKAFIHHWWNRQPFNLQLKDYEGNCDMCYKKSERKLLTLILEKPELIEWWKRMEHTYENGLQSFFRNHTTAEELIEKARAGGFDRVSDQEGGQAFDPVLDTELACTCLDK